MNTAMRQENLLEMLDQVVREITQQMTGITLCPSGNGVDGELGTVAITFLEGFRTTLSLCAEMSLFKQMAQYIMMEEQVTPQDVEAVAKEYINVLCGHIAARLFSTSKKPTRFSIPAFYQGQYAPDHHWEHITLTYSSGEGKNIRLIHYVPLEIPG